MIGRLHLNLNLNKKKSNNERLNFDGLFDKNCEPALSINYAQ